MTGVLTGAYVAGAKMPSLREVKEEFGVSRATSRAAYQMLIGEGAGRGSVRWRVLRAQLAGWF